MFSINNGFIQIAAVLISILTIFAFVWFVSKQTQTFLSKERQSLLILIVFAFSVLLGVYVVDKVVAFKLQLLTNEENVSIFSLIKDLTLLVFGYYFGANSQKPNNDESNKNDNI